MSDAGKRKINPLFVRSKTEPSMVKKLDEIDAPPKRTVRKDWTPRLAKSETVVEADDMTPKLSSGGEAVSPSDTSESSDDVSADGDRAARPVERVRPEGVSRVTRPRVPAPGSGTSAGGRVVRPALNVPSRRDPATPRSLNGDTPATGGADKSSIFLGGSPGKGKGGSVSSSGGVSPLSVNSPRRNGLEGRKPEEQHKDQRPTVLKAKAGVKVEDWTNDTTTDTDRGFGAEKETVVEPELGSGFHLTERDITLIRFLARYRYAYSFQLARLVRTSVKGIRPRLKTLETRGFIRRQVVTGSQHIWLSTKAGNLVADVDLPAIKKSDLSLVTVAHTLGLVNVGIEIETGGENLLREEVWPTMNNFDIRGRPVAGERVITEKEIRAGQQKWRMNRGTTEMRQVVEQALLDMGEPVTDDETGDYVYDELTGEVKYVNVPEMIEGNEGLFVIYSPTGEHIPDMVVSRGRDSNGVPINIAIELELHEKTYADWKRILRTYRDYGQMFSKVIYFTHKRNISNQLQKINATDIHLPDDKFIIRKYIPVNGREPFWG